MEEKKEETAAPVPKRQFVKWTCLLRAFDRDGGEIKNGANEDAMTAAWSLEECIKNSPSSSVMLVRNDIGEDGQFRGDVVTVVALRHDATPIEVITTLQRAIDVTLGRSAMNPKANDDGQIADKVRSQTIQAVEFPSQTQEAAAKILAQQEPACGVVASEVGTIRADNHSTKALEKIIKRQEKRIEDLARKNGNLECVVTSYEPFHNRLLAATNAKELSEAVAVAEKVISEYYKSRIVPVANKD